MEITKPNDVFVATINNPQATTYDLMTLGMSPDNTGLLSKDDYKQSDYIKDKFTTPDGKFDDTSFDNAYKLAAYHFEEMGNDQYIKDLETVQYNPFDITRPKNAKVSTVKVSFEKEINPYKHKYGHTGLYSVDESPFSLRELAQKTDIFDTRTNQWLGKSANDLSFFQKFFKDTLVYAQWDEDGIHIDPVTGVGVNHTKGDWKLNENGDFYLETLGGREIYDKQIVNPMDLITVDGSFANQFDFFDSDSKDKSIAGTFFKMAAEIAPFLIPGVRNVYAGVRAGIGLAATLPTFYKSFESILYGDKYNPLNSKVNQFEGYMSKFRQKSFSDKGMESMLNFEQFGGLVVDVYSQIHEQRAMASLSKYLVNQQKAEAAIAAKYGEILKKTQAEMFEAIGKNKLSLDDFKAIQNAAMAKLPELQSVMKAQSTLSKALSLGYMAFISASDVYGEALKGGYDRRTAGFASVAVASSLYGLMANNRMGDWFLDKTTGYTMETNRALTNKSMKPFMDEIAATFKGVKNKEDQLSKLGGIFGKIKTNLNDLLTSPSVLAENMWKNALIEGIEEVTEELVEDTVKGTIDFLSYIGMIKSDGSFGVWESMTTAEGFQEAFQRYIANFAGGLLGGAMFEFERTHLSKYIDPKNHVVMDDTLQHISRMIANGNKNDIVAYINKYSNKMANNSVSLYTDSNAIPESSEKYGVSQADVVKNIALGIINNVEGVLDAYDFNHSDEDIVKRAVLDHLVFQQLDALRVEGKAIGIEGKIISDFTNIQTQLVKKGLELKNALEKDPSGDYSIITEDIKKLERLGKDILEGKNSRKYFDQLMMMLNKDVAEAFLMMDRDSYTRHTYDVEYDTLSEEGPGLSKQRINQEWNGMIEGKNLINHLETVTNAYLEWEKNLNAPIADYAENGYAKVRTDTYKNIIDLNQTLRLFETAATSEERQAAVNRFIEINKYFQDLKKDTLLPWDVLHANLGQEFIDKGLLTKKEFAGLDEKGNLTFTETTFTPEELVKVNEEINTIFKAFPTQVLDLDLMVNDFNVLQEHNIKVKVDKVNDLRKKDTRTAEEEDELKELENNLYAINLLGTENTPEVVNVKKAAQEKRVNDLQEFGIKNGYGDDVKVIEETLDKWSFASNNSEIDQDFSSTLETLQSETPNLEHDVRVNLLNKLLNSGVLGQVLEGLKSDDTADLLKLLEEIEGLDTNSENGVTIRQKIFEDYSSIITTATQRYNELFNLKSKTTFNELSKKLVQLEEKTAKDIEKAKPEFFQLRNYTLEFLLNQLKAGDVDEEIFLEVQDQIRVVKDNIAKDLSLDGQFENIFKILNDANTVETILGYGADIESGAADDTDISDLDISDDQKLALKSLIESSPSSKDLISDAASLIEFIQANLTKHQKSLDLINDFEANIPNYNLKRNPLYNFISNFALSLDSNSKVGKIMDILAAEERYLSQASTVSNFASDNIRDTDILQAIRVLEIINTVVHAMSTTENTVGNPVGFIKQRQEFERRNQLESQVGHLKTLTAAQAHLMSMDVKRLINKLRFIKQVSDSNAGKRMVEEASIRRTMDGIMLEHWNNMADKLDKSFLPGTKVKEITNSDKSTARKVLEIENLFYETNKNKKEEALQALMNSYDFIDPEKTSKIDRDVSIAKISDYDMLTIMASKLVVKASDTYLLSKNSLEKYNKAPFYVQDLGSLVVRASTIRPDLFAKITRKFYNPTNEDAAFITIIPGGAGTGKTTAVAGLSIDQLRMTNKGTILRITAPTDLQTNNLYKSVVEAISEEGLNTSHSNKDALFDDLGVGELVRAIRIELTKLDESTTREEIRKGTNDKANKYVAFEDGRVYIELPADWKNSVNYDILPNLLLIDEVTHFSAAELRILSEISEESWLRGDTNFMKVIAAGDNTQLGNFYKYKENYYAYNTNSINATKAPRLWVNIRADNTLKRVNTDMLASKTDAVSEFYDPIMINGEVKQLNRDEADARALEYLGSDFLVLDWSHKKDGVYGDIITKELSQSHIGSIAEALKEDATKTLGILTSNGTIPNEWKVLLENAGVSDSQIKTFLPTNVQGSETNFFIFASDEVTKFPTLRDKFKAIYTFMTRAKEGSIVVDPEGAIKEQLKIINNSQESTPLKYDPLTAEVIKKAKDVRLEEIDNVLNGEFTLSDEANFHWKMGKKAETTDEAVDLIDSDSIHPPTGDIKGYTNFVPTPSGDGKPDKVSKPVYGDRKNNSIEGKDFNYILYSFYKNANAEIVKKKGGGYSIKAHNGILSDMNFTADLTAKELEIIENQWLNLKTYLTNALIDNPTNKVNVRSVEYKDYLIKLFGENSLDNTVNLSDINLVITTSRYNENLNAPQNKVLRDTTKELKNGSLFINLAARIKYRDKVRYVTLASFPKLSTLLESALPKVVDSDRATVEERIKKSFGSLELELQRAESRNEHSVIYEINGDPKTYFLTGTRILIPDSGYETTKLSDLKSKFKDANFSEIKLFPSTQDRFNEVIREYWYEYDGQQVSEEYLKDWYPKLKNKPYIEVSFGTNMDKKYKKLIPVYANYRNKKDLRRDALEIHREILKVIEKKKGGKLSEGDFRHINVKSDSMMHKSNILDIMIEWGMKSKEGVSLLDNLLKVYTPKTPLFGNDSFSLLDIITRFKSKEEGVTYDQKGRIVNIINAIKDTIAKNPGKSEEDIKKILLNGSYRTYFAGLWNKGFHNLFIYDVLIDGQKNKEFNTAIAQFFQGSLENVIDESGFVNIDTSVYEEMAKDMKKLIDEVSTEKKFYYSMPIQKAKGVEGLQIHEHTNGRLGFEKDSYFDNFYISVLLEAPNIMLPLDVITELTQSDVVEESEVTQEDVVEEIVAEKSTNTPASWSSVYTQLNKIKGTVAEKDIDLVINKYKVLEFIEDNLGISQLNNVDLEQLKDVNIAGVHASNLLTQLGIVGQNAFKARIDLISTLGLEKLDSSINQKLLELLRKICS